MTTTTLPAAGQPALKAERERRFEKLAAAADSESARQALQAELDGAGEEFQRLVDKIKALRERQRLIPHPSMRVIHQGWLRSNPPQWMVEEHQRLDRQRRQLAADYEQPLRRYEFLDSELDRLKSRAASRGVEWEPPKELAEKLEAVRNRLSGYREQLAAIKRRKDALVRRAIREAWPEPEEDMGDDG